MPLRKRATVDVNLYMHGDPLMGEVAHLLRKVVEGQEKIMGQLEDLQAALDATGTALDGIGGEVTNLGAEVQNLINKLGTIPPSPDLTAALTQAQAIQGKVAAIDAALKAIPAAP